MGLGRRAAKRDSKTRVYGGKTLRERMLQEVEVVTESGCWIHLGHSVGAGYSERSSGRAHREFYREFVGEIPAGKVVAHLCDVPSCVNPRHLVACTQAENIAHKVQKGRQARGMRNGASKLTDATVREIRAELEKYTFGTYTRLAQQYGVDRAVITRIAKNRAWTHVA